jgi:hypothetical protein
MKRVAWTTAVLLLLCGCTPERGVTVYTARPDRPVANLALGPTADHTWLAENMTYRSTWPSVETGYQYGETTSYTQFLLDDQSYYDDHGGGFSRQSISVRSGVIVR